jgi:hypothetical protein
MTRWQLYDPVADQTFHFSHNPATMTSMAQPHTTKSLATSPIDGKVRSARTPDKPFVWSFSGKVRTKAEYDALDAWVNRPNRLRVTDHFGRVHEVLGQHFSPTPVEKSGVPNPWLFGYTVDTLYYRRIS